MKQTCRPTNWGLFFAVCTLAFWPGAATATTIILRDGRILEGSLGTIGGMAENALEIAAKGGEGGVRPILFIDDNLRRTFIPKALVAKIEDAGPAEVPTKINVRQRVALSGKRILRVGPIVEISDFDQYGRRTFTMQTDKGPMPVIQGITVITPQWTKVEGLTGESPHIWDMRIATSSIPRQTLQAILSRHIDTKNLDQRLQLVRLLLQAERYLEAQAELNQIIDEFPTEEHLQVEARALRQLVAQKMIEEINLRRSSGQHRLYYSLLDQFPREDVAGELLQQIREMLTQTQDLQNQGKDLLADLQANVEGIDDSKLREMCKEVYDEIYAELNFNTIDRMADYIRLSDDPALKHDAKFSLAASAWLLGSNNATTNLQVALSLYEIRNLVRQYLREPLRHKRDELLQQIRMLEGASPTQVARILAHMKPPIDTDWDDTNPAGYFTLSLPGLDKEPDVVYHIQLPPEYDPYRRYPTVVTLHGAGTTAPQQIDWWAGSLAPNRTRTGQAGRHGYIVIAVEWAKQGQRQYDYSAPEHHAVLASLRDACRRFAIDTDRVFLSGHSMGGDAAWDIGLAHPDLWAGVIPIVGVSDRYCAHYYENAKLLPFYVVAGELDGDKTKRNARDLDRVLMRRYDFTISEFIGRGHEHFSDEIQRIFDWMGRRKRDFYPREFKVSTMRTWDNFFWWTEVSAFPPRSVVEPNQWPPRRGFRAMELKAQAVNNNISITSGASKVAVWLAPELVDFSQPIQVRVNGKSLNPGKGRFVEPDIEIILEDARTRADRLHPFWAKVE